MQHGDPTVFGGDAQVFVFVERVFLVLVIAGRVRRAAEGVQREVAAAGVAVLRQFGGLLQLAEQGQLQRCRAFVVDAVIHADRIVVAFEHESLGVDRAVFIGVGQRDAQLVLAFRQGVAVLCRLIQRAFAVGRVVRAVLPVRPLCA